MSDTTATAGGTASVTGACLCGAVRVRVTGGLPAPDACHCSQCRKMSGHFWSASDVPREALSVEGEEHVRWYRSSAKVRRGFCSVCGSSLFFDPDTTPWIAVSMGLFDTPTGTRQSKHIFTADKGDYYEIGDGLPQNPQ